MKRHALRTPSRLALLPVAALALTLSACGGSDGGSASDDASSSPSASESPSASASASESPSESASESASASPSDEASGSAAGLRYRTLITELFDQQGTVQNATSVEDFNRQAKFPAGVSVGIFDAVTKSICIQDAKQDIGLTFTGSGNAAGVVLLDGRCKGGKVVSRLVPQGADDIAVKGDASLGTPVADYLKETFGS